MTLPQTHSRSHLHSADIPLSESSYSKSATLSNSNKEKPLPPLSRLLDNLWNSSRTFKLSIILAIVVIQIIFYQLIIKRSLSNPSILYKRKEFYSHLGKDKYLTDRLANSKSIFHIIADVNTENQDSFKSFNIAKCIAEKLPNYSPKVTNNYQSHPNHEQFYNAVLDLKSKIDTDSSWIVKPFKSVWSKWSQQFLSPYIILENGDNYQEIGSTSEFIDFASKYYLEHHPDVVIACRNL